jgi:hypothetical protein
MDRARIGFVYNMQSRNKQDKRRHLHWSAGEDSRTQNFATEENTSAAVQEPERRSSIPSNTDSQGNRIAFVSYCIVMGDLSLHAAATLYRCGQPFSTWYLVIPTMTSGGRGGGEADPDCQ